MDCSVGFRTGGTCGHRILASIDRFLPSHFLLPTLLPLSCPFSSSSSSFIILLPLVSGAGGEPQAGSDTASGAGGRPPRPGPRWVLGAATPEAGPGSPTPRPARPTTPTCHPMDSGMPEVSGVSVGGDRVGRARGGPGEAEVWRRRDTLKMCSGWAPV